MRRLTLVVLVLALASACRPAATAPKPRPVKPEKLECRGGWTISLGRDGQPLDSLYTGC